MASRLRNASIIAMVASLVVFTGAAQDVKPKLEEYLAASVKQRLFNGSVLVARQGQVILSQGYGMANIELDVPNSAQTKFRLGSITKQFTAAAILILQEQGKLSVSDSICKYFPECPTAWQTVTIHHLLSHTGGLPNFTGFPDYLKTMTLPSSTEQTIGRFKDKPLVFAPGSKYQYSNSGYVALGAIVEKVSGQSYADFARTRIFEPLRMTNTGYDRTDQILKNRANGYSNERGDWTNAPFLDMTIPHAAGALYSTVEDLYLWSQALYSEKPLTAKSLAVMTTPVLNDYAYGLAVNKQFNRKQISHGGGINGFSTFMARYPDEGLTVIVLSNLQQARTGAIARDLAAIAFGEVYEIPKARVAIKVDPKIYDMYIGRYELSPTATLTISRQGDQLFAQMTGQTQLELFPESETKFFLKAVDAQVTFFKNSEGKVTQLILHQGGDRIAKKLE